MASDDQGASVDRADPVLLANEAKLRDRLASVDFTGPAYDLFADALARYGLRVMQGWLRSGLIFKQVRRRYSMIRLCLPTDGWSLEDQDDIAADVVAAALVRFRQDALIGGEWRPEGGAAMSTYFIGTCLGEFPNVFRAWLRRRSRRGSQVEELREPQQLPPDWTADPAEEFAAVVELAERLATLNDRQRFAVTMVACGFSQAEIAHILNITEQAGRALLRRAMRKLRGTEGGLSDD